MRAYMYALTLLLLPLQAQAQAQQTPRPGELYEYVGTICEDLAIIRRVGETFAQHGPDADRLLANDPEFRTHCFDTRAQPIPPNGRQWFVNFSIRRYLADSWWDGTRRRLLVQGVAVGRHGETPLYAFVEYQDET